MQYKKYTKENLTEAAAMSNSFADVARHFGVAPQGGTQAHLKKRMVDEGVDFSHFKGRAWSREAVFLNRRRSSDDILQKLPEGSNRVNAHLLRRALIEVGVEQVCSICKINEWNGLPLDLEVDHIDGDYRNNTKDNLRFLCPNCHSQTGNYKAKNIGR
jgi:hypothetical protein